MSIAEILLSVALAAVSIPTVYSLWVDLQSGRRGLSDRRRRLVLLSVGVTLLLVLYAAGGHLLITLGGLVVVWLNAFVFLRRLRDG